MYCTECGKSNADNAIFCKYCGTRIADIIDRQSMDGNLKNTVKKYLFSQHARHIIIVIVVIIILLVCIYSGVEYFRVTSNKDTASKKPSNINGENHSIDGQKFVYSYESILAAAEETEEWGASGRIVVHLNYNPATGLSFDNQRKVSVDKKRDYSILEPPDRYNHGKYTLIFLDNTGNIISERKFNNRIGYFDVDMYYFSICRTLIILDQNKKEILRTDVSQFQTCNGNGICEIEKREGNHCIPDCGSGKVRYSGLTKQMLKDYNGIIKHRKTGEILLKGNIK